MLYLTAHLVNTNEGTKAINAFLHAENNELMGAMCEVRPGNNHVLSYLDVWVPGPLPLRINDIQSSLSAAREHLHREDTEIPFTLKTSGINVEFGCTIGVFKDKRYTHDFTELEKRIVALAKDPHHWSPAVPRAALVATIARNEDTIVYTMTDESKRRLLEIHGKHWVAKRVSVDQFDLMDLEALHGSINADLVQTMTDIPLSHISKYGGIKYINAITGKTIWQYP
jgi:hypothetical protein